MSLAIIGGEDNREKHLRKKFERFGWIEVEVEVPHYICALLFKRFLGGCQQETFSNFLVLLLPFPVYKKVSYGTYTIVVTVTLCTIMTSPMVFKTQTDYITATNIINGQWIHAIRDQHLTMGLYWATWWTSHGRTNSQGSFC